MSIFFKLNFFVLNFYLFFYSFQLFDFNIISEEVYISFFLSIYIYFIYFYLNNNIIRFIDELFSYSTMILNYNFLLLLKIKINNFFKFICLEFFFILNLFNLKKFILMYLKSFYKSFVYFLFNKFYTLLKFINFIYYLIVFESYKFIDYKNFLYVENRYYVIHIQDLLNYSKYKFNFLNNNNNLNVFKLLLFKNSFFMYYLFFIYFYFRIKIYFFGLRYKFLKVKYYLLK